MGSEKEILKAVEAGFQKQMELQKLIAKQLLKITKQQEKLLDVFEQAAEDLSDV